AEVDGMKRLLMKSREGSLNATEWRALRALTRQGEVWMPERGTLAGRSVEALSQRGTLDRENTEVVGGLLARLDDVCEYLSHHQAGWREAGTRSRVEATLPMQGGRQVEVERYVLPASAFGAHFVNGYPSEESLRQHGAARYSHLPGLSGVTLTNARGEVLFAGLRHDLFPGGELNDKLLARLTDEELKNVIGINFLGIQPDCPPVLQGAVASGLFSIFRSAGENSRLSEGKSRGLAKLQNSAHQFAVSDLAAAVFVCDPKAVRADLRGELKPVKLFSMALLKPGDVELWRGQHERLSALGDDGTIQVNLPSDERPLHSQVMVRQFALCVGKDPAAQRQCLAVNREAGMRLLGPLESPGLGGDLKASLELRKGIIDRHLRMRTAAQEDYRQLVRDLGSTHWKSKSSYGRLCLLDLEAKRMHRSVSAVEKLGTQVKARLTPEGDWPSRAAAQRQVAARLALIGYLMDETPVLSCAGGSNLVGRLEADINFLAAVTDCAGGVPPEIEPDRRLLQPAPAAFESPASPSGQGGGLATGPARESDMRVIRGMSLPVKLAGGRLVKSGFKVNLLQKLPAADQPSETTRKPMRSRMDGDRNPDVWLEPRPRGAPADYRSDISDVQ
ncbi:MAG: hypothetical protein OXE40_09930, partial [Gammaproteobacteria bacterium]|nr:hypothetical protein [Gammaproteobacteria bacterium]